MNICDRIFIKVSNSFYCYFIFCISVSFRFLTNIHNRPPKDNNIPRIPKPIPNPNENISNKRNGVVALDLNSSAYSSLIVAVSSVHIKGKYTFLTFFSTRIDEVGLT